MGPIERACTRQLRTFDYTFSIQAIFTLLVVEKNGMFEYRRGGLTVGELGPPKPISAKIWGTFHVKKVCELQKTDENSLFLIFSIETNVIAFYDVLGAYGASIHLSKSHFYLKIG